MVKCIINLKETKKLLSDKELMNLLYLKNYLIEYRLLQNEKERAESLKIHMDMYLEEF
ncbi:hypothetical protein D3C81_2290090 [compost metagenome]